MHVIVVSMIQFNFVICVSIISEAIYVLSNFHILHSRNFKRN